MKLPIRRKFHNVPIVVDDIKFDSKREAKRWGELRLLERLGKITALLRQVRFPIIVNGVRVCCYWADFAYVEGNERIVEDVKSEFTRKNPVYRLKKKLVKATLGIDIQEVIT